MLTHWLLSTTDTAIKKKKPDYSKLKPLFCLPKLGVAASVEVSRRDRRSPRMSMISSDIRNSFKEPRGGQTPDSRRQSTVMGRISHESGDRDYLSDSQVQLDLKLKPITIFKVDLVKLAVSKFAAQVALSIWEKYFMVWFWFCQLER